MANIVNKRKNVVFLVIDSLGNYNRQSVEEKIMPFMAKLKNESLYFPNMFSEAPYTEAAVMSMLCGKNTLEDEGYLYRFDRSHNIFEYFKENGYEVYNYVQPHVHPSSILKGNTHFYYNVCFDFNVVWEYRLYLYSKLYKENKLHSKDYEKISELLDDNFTFWSYFFETYLQGNEAFSLIKNNLEQIYTSEYVAEQLAKVLKQKKCYFNDKKTYINELLNQGKEHEVFKIGILNQNVKVSEKTREWLIQNYEGCFKKIARVNKKNNFKLNKLNWTGIYSDAVTALKKHNYEKLKGNFAYFKNSVFDRDLMDRLYRSDAFKAAPSLYSHIKHFEKLLEKRDGSSPFFSCIHVDDIHNPEIFFTYDTDDLELLKQEFEDIEKTLDKYAEGLTGSATYYLSLAYIDKKIEYLFNVLEKQGVLQDTVIVITGDHGFSFDYVNIRNSCVNNHYLENYNVPLYIYDYGNAKSVDERICSSKDILPTLLEYLELQSLDNKNTGTSLLGKPVDYVILQNVMGGCPDLEHRKVEMGILTKTELLVGEASLETDFSIIELMEYYDLKSDPQQRRNQLSKQKDIQSREIYKNLQNEFAALYQNIKSSR